MISSSPIRTLKRACSQKSPRGCEGCRATQSARENAQVLLIERVGIGAAQQSIGTPYRLEMDTTVVRLTDIPPHQRQTLRSNIGRTHVETDRHVLNTCL